MPRLTSRPDPETACGRASLDPCRAKRDHRRGSSVSSWLRVNPFPPQLSVICHTLDAVEQTADERASIDPDFGDQRLAVVVEPRDVRWSGV